MVLMDVSPNRIRIPLGAGQRNPGRGRRAEDLGANLVPRRPCLLANGPEGFGGDAEAGGDEVIVERLLFATLSLGLGNGDEAAVGVGGSVPSLPFNLGKQLHSEHLDNAKGRRNVF